MVRRHWVRDHDRSNTKGGVNAYQRGTGGAGAVPYQGTFKGSMNSRPENDQKKGPGFFSRLGTKVQTKLAEAKKEHEAEENIRTAVRAEQQEKAQEEFKTERLARIEQEERIRATQGPAWKRAVKSGAQYAGAAVKGSLATPKPRRAKGSRRRRTAAPQTVIYAGGAPARAPAKRKKREARSGNVWESGGSVWG